MNLEQYRKVINKRIAWMRLVWLAYLLLDAVMYFGMEHVTEHPAYNLLLGAMMGATLMSLVLAFRYRRVLKDDGLLRKMYNREHDERMAAIRARAGFPMTIILSLAMLAAAMVASLFSIPVMMTLVATAAAQLLVCFAVKLYYMKTM